MGSSLILYGSTWPIRIIEWYSQHVPSSICNPHHHPLSNTRGDVPPLNIIITHLCLGHVQKPSLTTIFLGWIQNCQLRFGAELTWRALLSQLCYNLNNCQQGRARRRSEIIPGILQVYPTSLPGEVKVIAILSQTVHHDILPLFSYAFWTLVQATFRPPFSFCFI